MELLRVPVCSSSWTPDYDDLSDLTSQLQVLQTTVSSTKRVVFDEWIGKQMKMFWQQNAVLRQELTSCCQELEENYKQQLIELQRDRIAKEHQATECGCESEKLTEYHELLCSELDARLYAREQVNETIKQLQNSCTAISQDVTGKKSKCDEIHEALETVIKTYSNRLGLEIRSVHGNIDKAVNIEFIFTFIAPNDVHRPFAFSLKLLPDKTFTVTDCKPFIDDLDTLMGRLNKTLDWHTFLLSVRQRFTQYAAEN